MTKEQFYQGMKSISMFILFSLKLNLMLNLNFSIIDDGNLSNCLIHQCTPLTNYRMQNSPCIVSYPYSSFYGCLGNSRIYFINFSIQNIQILHFCYIIIPLIWWLEVMLLQLLLQLSIVFSNDSTSISHHFLGIIFFFVGTPQPFFIHPGRLVNLQISYFCISTFLFIIQPTFAFMLCMSFHKVQNVH